MEHGTRVRLTGLVARAELNGHIAEIASATPVSGIGGEERHLVALHNNFARLKIKPCNLRPLHSPGADRLLSGCAPSWVLRRLLELPMLPELAAEVLSFLRIDAPSRTWAVCATSEARSSGRGGFSFSKEAALSEGEADCWISAENSMPGGRGSQGIVFDLGAKTQVNELRIAIPKMPLGPLSVKEFRLEACEFAPPRAVSTKRSQPSRSDASHAPRGSGDADSGEEGEEGSSVLAEPAVEWGDFVPSLGSTVTLRTLDEQGPQPIAIFPPLEARFFRLVCLSTAQAVAFPDSSSLRTACGLWSVSFL